MKQVNVYRFLEHIFCKILCFWCEVAFVVGVTMNRLHHSQSDSVRSINVCAMVTALELFWREEGRRLIRFVWENFFFS